MRHITFIAFQKLLEALGGLKTLSIRSLDTVIAVNAADIESWLLDWQPGHASLALDVFLAFAAEAGFSFVLFHCVGLSANS